MSMREIDHILRTYSSKDFTGRLLKIILVAIIMRFEPFTLEYSPQCLGYVEVSEVRRLKEEKQTSLHPFMRHSCNLPLSVYRSVVEDHNCRLCDFSGKFIKGINQDLTANCVFCLKAIIKTRGRNHAEEVEAVLGIRRHAHLFTLQMPSKKEVATGTYLHDSRLQTGGLCTRLPGVLQVLAAVPS